ncbi:MAG: hypothetical protein AB7O97_01785 [Planctomycetota bacterium]
MHRLFRSLRIAAAAAPFSLLVATPPALAQGPAVSPTDRSGLEGSSFTHFPLGRPDARFQFLHDDVPAGMVIGGHAYRRDAAQVRGRVDAFTADVEVRLSLAQTTAATASGTFANNAGANPTLVLPRTTLVFPPTDRPALDPSPTFDLVVPYAVPFVMPPTPATLCVDMTLFGNSSAAGTDRNLSIYLDAHEVSTTVNEQPGFRTGQGCPAPGASAAATATMTLLHQGASMQLDIASRDGAHDDGSGLTHAFLGVGTAQVSVPWPFQPACVMQSSSDLWFALPGTNDAQGDLDTAMTWPVLPPGSRLFLQVGSIHLATIDLVMSDLTVLSMPFAPPATQTAARVSASTNRLATSGSIAASVPVTQFF